MAFDSTPGSPTANSLLSVEDADAMAADYIYTDAWTAIPTVDPPVRKQQLLVTATLEFLIRTCFLGVPTTPDQSLPFPMSGLVHPNGHPVDPATIPFEIQYAVFRYALLLAKSDVLNPTDVAVQGLVKLQVGSIRLQWKPDIPFEPLPDQIRFLLPPSWLCAQQPGQVYTGFAVRSLGKGY